MNAQDRTTTKSCRYEIELRAYELWLGDGRPEGSHRPYWERAEGEFRSGTPIIGLPLLDLRRPLPAGIRPE